MYGLSKKFYFNQSKKEKPRDREPQKIKPKIEIRTYSEEHSEGVTKDVVFGTKAKSKIDMFQKNIKQMQADPDNEPGSIPSAETAKPRRPPTIRRRDKVSETKKIFEKPPAPKPPIFRDQKPNTSNIVKEKAIAPKHSGGNVHDKIRKFTVVPIPEPKTYPKPPAPKLRQSFKRKPERNKFMVVTKDVEEYVVIATVGSCSNASVSSAAGVCCSTPPPPFEEAPPPRTSRTNSSSTTSSSASGRRRGASSAASVVTTSSASSLALTPAALSSARSNEASVCWTPPASVEGSTPTWTEGTPSFTESSSSEQGYPITPARGATPSEGRRSPRAPPPPARINPPTTINCLTSEVVEITHLTSETSNISISTYEVHQQMQQLQIEEKHC
ncbi:hypothetical protein RR48_10189 [Papilio machaon]|uniref:Uncharacterized protein n=1 Tax=Papilio machaon TaxID=76193 RepID=A0A194R0F8_PAPMA|nr:hypothetical protein RR48_10189 [Papilio machaon]